LSLRLSAEPEELKSKFAALKTRQDVADLLEVDRAHLNYHLHISPHSTRYTAFEIPKRSGGTRKITAPVTALKIIQRKLNQVLQLVYYDKRRPPVHSFISDHSILTNAKKHLGREWVLNLDLKDFFPSITVFRVMGLFKKKPYEIPSPAATVLAQICCFEDKLPQGAPTSPIVSNMICAKLDNELNRFAIKHKCRYTRYADDITFSTYNYDFPSALAKINPLGQVELGDELKRIIDQNWFEVNPDKVRLRRRNLRQEVTGLTVNDFAKSGRPNVRRQYVRQIRAMLHAWEKDGLDKAEREFLKRHYKKHRAPFKKLPSLIQILNGKIGFLGMVVGKDSPVYLRYYRQFKRLCLLKIYQDLEESKNFQQRGYLLQDLLNKMFKLYDIPAVPSFTRNEGAEQIDGGFNLEGQHYLAECRWRKEPADDNEVSPFYTKVSRSGGQPMGLFLSINGWSTNVPKLLKENPLKCVVLMDGNDLYSVLNSNIGLQEFIKAKVQYFNFKGEPFYGAEQYLADSHSA
jgi:RNA-directed DNA polymerase